MENSVALPSSDGLLMCWVIWKFACPPHRRTPGWAANPTAQGVSLRGLGASGASRALVLADGVPLSDPLGGWVYWNQIPRTELQAIEVAVGPESDLYGTDALGGAIQLLRRASTG